MEERTEYLIGGIGAVLLSFGIILFLFLGYYMYAEDAGVPKDTLRNILGANVVGWM